MHEHKLIFLLSLPRSGSTLLQRMLAISPEIQTISEPWLLLPLSSTIQNKHTLSMYNHQFASKAIEDFIQTLPNKHTDFYEAVEKFVLSLYFHPFSNDNVRYFLDKTPRYYMIIKFLSNVFPMAKFIFLFRNPLEVLASIVSSWTDNKFYLYRYYLDLFYGPPALAEGFKELENRAIRVNYRDLVQSPNSEMKKICSFLDIKYGQGMIDKFTRIQLNGRMGDKKGVKEYKNITTESLDKWKGILNTSYRKMYAKRYINKLGDETLVTFGTDKNEMLREIASIRNIQHSSLLDCFYHTTSTIKRLVLIDYYKNLLKFSRKKKSLYPYL